METIFAQVVADTWQVEPEDVVIALADTAAIAMGFGTMASRSTVTMSAAIHHASERLRSKVLCDRRQSPGMRARRSRTARGRRRHRRRARPIGDASPRSRKRRVPGWDNGRPPGIDAGLEETFYYEPPTVTWSYAVHAAIVELDIETGRVAIERYVVAHDCGVVVNPMLVEGQIIGGAVQGLGGALLEDLVYDAEGQLLTGSLMDYRLPTASDVPTMQLIHMHSPSPLNPLGVKGVGEGGAIAPPVVDRQRRLRRAFGLQRRIQRNAGAAGTDCAGSAALIDLDHHLAEMRLRLQVAIGGFGFREGEDAVDDGLQFVQGDGAVHRLE